MEITGIAYVGFESPNHKEMLDVGPHVFGFGLEESRDDDVVYLRMDDRFFRVAVHPGNENRLAYLGWEVRTHRLWDDAVAKLLASGVDVTIGGRELCDQRGVSGVAQFLDRAGWPHELIWGQWHRPHSFLPGRPHSGFWQTERYGLGHTVLRAANKEEADDFVEDVLGFNRFEGTGVWPHLSTFRAKLNDVTHNFSYQIDPTHEYGDTTVSASWGFHIGIYNNELIDVQIANDRAELRGLPYNHHIQAVAFDPAVAFYVETPAGFGIQYHTPPNLAPADSYIEKVAQPGTFLAFGPPPVRRIK